MTAMRNKTKDIAHVDTTGMFAETKKTTRGR